MTSIVPNLWLIPALPMLAAGISALLPQRSRKPAAALAIGSMGVSFVLALCAFAQTLHSPAPQTFNFTWFQFGDQSLQLGWLLDPLTAVMLVMVTFVGLLIFVYSTGYMEHDENFTRFFCFLALFAGAMLGVVISNSLLLLFMCWEIVGLTSYLLIGFWYQNPRAAAAAKKAFITTRIGDLGFLIGMVWLYAQTHTLLFYANGAGALEPSAINHLVWYGFPGAAISSPLIHWLFALPGFSAASAIAILIFCGAAGKSGQVPLHVWLPDAMEGPTPVSALIHAATMVAAGVFLVARVYPLFSAVFTDTVPGQISLALQVVTWVGAITALFGATVAVAQWDIKRILAYSTVSQLGYMMLGLGVGGPSVGMFHLITHAFFKALLFLGAGSVIHGCGGEQDIRRMGGLRRYMPLTFATYAIGMLALSGFPLVFSGFWSKDAILHAAHNWSVSQAPFYMATLGALLTAFYMTRQVCYVFFGTLRLPAHGPVAHDEPHSEDTQHHGAGHPHESPTVMTAPLAILAVCAILLGFLGTPAWPWFQSFLDGHAIESGGFHEPGVIAVMITSSAIFFLGLGLGWLLYGRQPTPTADAADPIGHRTPRTFRLLNNAWYIDAIYAATFVRLTRWLGYLADILDRFIFNGVVQVVSFAVLAIAWLDSFVDNYIVNFGFDTGWRTISLSGRALAALQGGRVQAYLRYIGLALVGLVIFLLWGAAR